MLANGMLASGLSRTLLDNDDRGQMHQDPVVFAIRDRVSYVVGACVALVLFGAAAGVPGRWLPLTPRPASTAVSNGAPR